MNYLPSDRLSQTESEASIANLMEPNLRLHQQPAPTENLLYYSASHSALFQSASQLDLKTKQALCQLLLTQLGVEQAREILDFAKLELAAREGRVSMIRKPPERCTRLVLKKDYSFQKLNLAHPTQYFVYLVRRKPKLDRYIGALFYIPQGFPLSYFPDAEGRIVFTPPNNLFKLIDSQSLKTQVVRLVSVDPPPPDYTFDRGQEDTPEIFLCLDYLDPITYEPLASERYHYPSCMYEGGKLDRYRWKVEPLVLPLELQTRLQCIPSAQSLAADPLESTDLLPVVQRRESLSVSSQN
ncbi:MAG: hypothetical protein HC772_09985 [Leptolyngbyaceae cyanobacterium CRU_2_3]|nr:hypothetical protein [Leptolyngbyaceae cyanobacterium CRU_2_3]